MTTITINNDEQMAKTSFDSVEELASYLLEHLKYGQLISLGDSEVTSAQNLRMEKALQSKKSDMRNI
ncbi:MAG: hypothetical protein AAGC88_09590 [Bacteroidota bacterium]